MLVTYVDFMKDFLLVSTEGADSGSVLLAGCIMCQYCVMALSDKLLVGRYDQEPVQRWL